MEPRPPIGLISLDHITIIVADLSATRKFYVELLGMSEINRPDFDFPGAWFAIDPSSERANIHATVASNFAGRAGWSDRGAQRLSRGHHFAFEVDDAPTLEKFLAKNGVEIVVQCRKRPDGPIQFYVKDPDGHVVELFSFSTTSPSQVDDNH